MDEFLHRKRQYVSVLPLPDQTNARPSAKTILCDSIRVPFYSPDAGTAEEFATATADIFIDEDLECRIAQVSAASEFIDQSATVRLGVPETSYVADKSM